MVPNLAAGLLGSDVTFQQLLGIALVLAILGIGFVALVTLSRSFRRQGRRGAGLLLFASLVYLPLLGTYAVLDILHFTRRVINPKEAAEGAAEVTARYGHANVLLFLLLVIGVYLGVTLGEAMMFTKEREEQMGHKVPRILREMFRWMVVSGSAFFAAAAIWDLQFQNLTIFGSALTVGITIALGPTLGSLIAGVTLAADRPFELGDWIDVDGKQGRVDQITWRSTRIITRDNESVVYPNGKLAEVRIVNLSRPDGLLRIRCQVPVHLRTPPREARDAIRRAVLGTPGVLEKPDPIVRIQDYADSAVLWDVRFWIADPEPLENIRADVLQRVWYSFHRSGIEIPFPIRNLVMREKGWEGQPVPGAEEEELRRRARADVLRKVPIFALLPEPDLASLAGRSREEVFLDGERMTRQGEPGDRMFVLAAGRARVLVEARGPREVAELREGDCFGEMSILTGCPRSATVVALGDLHVLSLRAADLKPLLLAQPEFAGSLAQFAAERKMRLEELTAAVEARGPSTDLDSTSTNLLQEILRYFRLPGDRGPQAPGTGRK